MHLSILFCVCVLIFSSGIETVFSSVLFTPCNLLNSAILECGGQQTQNFRSYSVSGFNSLLQLRNLDPLYLPKISVNRKNSTIGPYELYLKYLAVSGAHRYQILTNYVNPDELLIKLKILFPNTKWSTTGLINGVVLGYPVNRTYVGDVDFQNLVMDFVLDGSEYVLLGRKYIVWREGSIEISQDYMHVNVDKLFEEPDKIQAFNDALNNNVHLVDQQVHHLIKNSFGHFIIELINQIHRTYPVDVLYPKF